jgi:hypothetical protein
VNLVIVAEGKMGKAGKEGKSAAGAFNNTGKRWRRFESHYGTSAGNKN